MTGINVWCFLYFYFRTKITYDVNDVTEIDFYVAYKISRIPTYMNNFMVAYFITQNQLARLCGVEVDH